MAAILENLHNVITVADRPIRVNFGTSMQNHMLMTTNIKLKIEIGSRISIWRPFVFYKLKLYSISINQSIFRVA